MTREDGNKLSDDSALWNSLNEDDFFKDIVDGDGAVDGEGVEVPLPDFIGHGGPITPSLWFESRDNDDVGTYKLRVYGSLLRRGRVVDVVVGGLQRLVLSEIPSLSACGLAHHWRRMGWIWNLR